MSYDILSTLREMEPTFSKGQKRIARYITEDYDKAAFMTANRLGKTVGVSESTVVRFAVDLGFDGYPSMQKAMQEMVLNRLTSVQRIEVANDRLGDQDVVSTVLRSDMEKIRQTEEMVSREEFSAAVNAILKAKRVYILGVRSVEPLANFLGYYLNYMFNNVHVVSGFGAGEMFEKIVSVNSSDVVIAFSNHAGVGELVDYCVSRGLPLVAATTGYTPEDFAKLEAGAKKIAIFQSYNMSVGVALLARLVKQAAAIFGGCDVEIVEAHHNRKVDAPSGTALMLADAVKSQRPDAEYVYGRSGQHKRQPNEIGIHSVRGGTIVGEHEIIFAGRDESVTLTHTAMSREIFAVGALNAAVFLSGCREARLYAMSDLIQAQ